MSRANVWVEAALNGPFTRARQPRIPVSVKEIVEDGIACAESGAAIIHVHAYDAETGRQRDDPDLYSRIIEGIRVRTGAIVYPTVALSGAAAARFRPIETLARRGLLEWMALDPGSVNLTLYRQIADDRPGLLYANPDDHIRHGLALAVRAGVHPAYAIYEPGFARAGAAWAERYPKLPQPIYRAMLSDGFTFGFPPQAWALDVYAQLRDRLTPGAPWMMAGLAVDLTPLTEEALARGFHIRVGLEDAPMGADDSNRAFVEAAVRRIRAAGFEPATAAEVRRHLPAPVP